MSTPTRPPSKLTQAFCWALALVLAFGGWPAPALEGLVGARTAQAEEVIALTDGADGSDGAADLAPTPDGVEAADEDAADEQAGGTQDSISEEADPEADPELLVADGGVWDGSGDVETLNFLDPPDCFYVTDENKDVRVTLDTKPTEDGYDLRWTVGLCVGDEWVWEHIFEQGVEYDIEGPAIILHGDKVLERRLGYGEPDSPLLHVRIFAELYDYSSPGENPVVANGTHWIDFAEPLIDYDYSREWDRDMLPGWEGKVEHWYSAQVWNDEHPHGDEMPYEVLRVGSSDESVVSVSLEDWETDYGYEHNWSYRAQGHGSATLTVVYRTLEGEEATYDFLVNVASDVYDVSWSTNNQYYGENNGSCRGLPGHCIEIRAEGVHHREGEEDTRDGFEYTWELVGRGANLASLEVSNGNDGSSTALVCFYPNESYRNNSWLSENVNVRLVARKNGQNVERVIGTYLSNEYPEIWLEGTDTTQINPNMRVGESCTVAPEVRYFVQDFGSQQARGLINRITWDFDQNAVRISDHGREIRSGEALDLDHEQFHTFQIERLKDYDTDIHLAIDWEPTEDMGRFALLPADKGGETDGWRHEHANWHLNRADTSIWFADASETAFVTETDQDVTLPLNHQNLDGVSGWSISYEVGTWENDAWTETLGTGEYSFTNDGITLDGYDILASRGRNEMDLRVWAEARIGGEPVSECDRWIKLVRGGVDYEHDREHDRDMLPGWDGEVRQWYNAWVNDQDHPGGEDVPYEVLDVTSSDPAVVSVEREDWGEGAGAGHKWRYTAEDRGGATLCVTYRALDGSEDTYEFVINVGDHVYGVSVGAREGDSWGLPGETLHLYAYGWHDYLDEQGQHRREDTNDPQSGFTLRWSLCDDDQRYATLESAEGTTNELVLQNPDGQGLQRDIWVDVVLCRDGIELAREDAQTAIAEGYETITPYAADFPSDVAVGEVIDVEPRRLWRSLEDGMTQERDVSDQTQFRLSFDGNAVDVTPGDGLNITRDDNNACVVTWTGKKTLRITRLQNWRTDLRLETAFGDGQRDGRTWSLEEQEYRLRLDEEESDVWVTRDENGYVADANPGILTSSLWLSDDLAKSGGVWFDVAIGDGEWDEDHFAWERTFEHGDYAWECVEEGGRRVVRLNINTIGENGVSEAKVRVRAMIDNTELAISENEWHVHLRERELDYDREWNRSLLPGWDGTVDGSYFVHVRDENHPEGADLPYEVINVEVVEGAGLLEMHPDNNEDDHWWYYRANEGAYGTATLRVDYERPEELGGGTASYTFDLVISPDVYDVRVWSADRSDNVLPGTRVELYAQGTHHRVDAEPTDEGLVYEWEVREGEQVGYLEEDPYDPKHATFVVNPMGPERMGFDDLVHVRVYLRDADSGNRVADKGWAFWVRNTYDELWPTFVDSDLPAGEQIDVTTELRRYLADPGTGGGFTVLPSMVEWDNVDTSKVSITDAAGDEVSNGGVRLGAGTFTIHRLSNESSHFRLRCYYEGDDGKEEYCDRWFEFNEIAGHRHSLVEVEAEPATCEEFGFMHHWRCEDCEKVFSDEAGKVETSIDDLRIDPHHDLQHVDAVAATCENAGVAAHWCCRVCDKVFSDADGQDGTSREALCIAPLGHSLEHVDAVAATYDAAGTEEHWKCSRCRKLFSDKDGTNETSLDELTTSKLERMSQTIEASNKTVTFGTTANLGAKLTKGEGALSYKSGNKGIATVSDSGVVTPVKVGTVTITITAAKKGAYKATSKNVTVTVAPAAQTISAANKSVAVGKTVSLGAKVTVGDGALSYKSGNKGIATVSSSGVVTPVKAGTVTITITAAAKGNYKATSKNVTVTVALGTQTITAANKSCYVGKTVGLAAKTSGDGKLTYKSSNTGIATVSATGVVTGKKAGTAKITVTAAKTSKYKAATKTVTVKVSKQNNPMTAKATKASLTVSYSTVTSKAVATAKNVTVSKAQGTLTYANASTNATAKKFTVNKTSGKVTVPKGTKKGTYPVIVKVTAAGNGSYLAGSKTVSYKVVVK